MVNAISVQILYNNLIHDKSPLLQQKHLPVKLKSCIISPYY